MYKIIQKRKYTYIASAILVVVSLTAIAMWGLKFGIDFKGGTLIRAQFTQDQEKDQIFDAVDAIGVNSLVVQKSEENTVLVRYIASTEVQNVAVQDTLKGIDEGVVFLSIDFIGASISEELKSNTLTAIVLAVVAIMFYIAWAFRSVSFPVSSWQYGFAAVIALFHDVIITVGIFAFLGKFFDVEVGVPFIAALLTILGYSVNDTIVIFDRIRENLLRSQGKEDFILLANRSINESLARSINTSGTLIVVLLAIIFFGGGSLTWFAVALSIGVVLGTYSSIFVATALLVSFYKKRHDKVIANEKEVNIESRK